MIDEFQKEPVLLDAIKAELNRSTRPGRYLLAGSTRYDALPVTAQALTGRAHILPVWPLSQAELSGTPRQGASTGALDVLLHRRRGVTIRCGSGTGAPETAPRCTACSSAATAESSGVEVKASSRVDGADARGLRGLADRLPDTWAGGAVLPPGYAGIHPGPQPIPARGTRIRPVGTDVACRTRSR